MLVNLDLVPLDELITTIALRSRAMVCVLSLPDDDGLAPEYSFTMKGTPHELLGLVAMLDIATHDEASAIMYPELAVGEDD